MLSRFFKTKENLELDKGELQKQIAYPSFNLRMLATIADTILLTFLILPFLKIFSSHFIFKGMNPKDVLNLDPSVTENIKGFGQFVRTITATEGYQKFFIENHGWRLIFFDQLLQICTFSFLILIFWIGYNGQTPGKMLFGIQVVDQKSFKPASTLKYCLRLLGYFVSAIPFFAGFIAIKTNKKGLGFHDRIAGTVVIKR